MWTIVARSIFGIWIIVIENINKTKYTLDPDINF